MSYNTFTLSNGLRIIHAPNLSKVAYCGFAVDAGTRDEYEQEQGMAHFVEHLIFKGTEKRHAWHILNRMENVGGDLNAYTNKEETVIYSAFLAEHFPRAVELLADIVFHSTFPQHEIDKEVEVIIDEIQSYEDSPSELIFDDFEELIFPNHPLGRNILGKPELLRQFTSRNALEFTARFYKTTNMVFFVQGNIDFKKVIRTVEKAVSDISLSETNRQRIAPFTYIPQTLTINKDTHQAHVMIGSRGYHAYDEKRTGLYLLNNILGGPGMNSRLNLALRERRGLVYNVEANLTSYTDTGVFCIYFGRPSGAGPRGTPGKRLCGCAGGSHHERRAAEPGTGDGPPGNGGRQKRAAVPSGILDERQNTVASDTDTEIYLFNLTDRSYDVVRHGQRRSLLCIWKRKTDRHFKLPGRGRTACR